MTSSLEARVLSVFAVVATSLLVLTAAVGVHPGSAIAQEKPSATRDKVGMTLTSTAGRVKCPGRMPVPLLPSLSNCHLVRNYHDWSKLS